MKRIIFLKNFKWILFLLLGSITPPMAFGIDVMERRYLGELHPPVIASDGDKNEIVVFFLKNEFKDSIANHHVGNGEIYYFPLHPIVKRLEYVWKIEGEEVISVFFYTWGESRLMGKSMFVLTRNGVSNKKYKGFSYSVTEFPFVREAGHLGLAFFEGDHQDEKLQNCFDGTNLEENKHLSCEYKSADNIKKYLKSQDRRESK
jgi:hypothetical protein